MVAIYKKRQYFKFFIIIKIKHLNYCGPPSPEGMDRIMSESPGSVIDIAHTRKYLPQAVPNSTLLPE